MVGWVAATPLPLVPDGIAGESERGTTLRPDEKGGFPMGKRARKSKARKKKKANHGKRPAAR